MSAEDRRAWWRDRPRFSGRGWDACHAGKARNVSTRAELEKALGKPTDIGKLGPVETWTYKASNGEVVFLLVGDKVTLQATGTPEKQR